jgi:hypothetical protein
MHYANTFSESASVKGKNIIYSDEIINDRVDFGGRLSFLKKS